MSHPTPRPGRRPESRSQQLPDAPPRQAGAVRASDAEREAVVEWLRVASVEGRLNLEELAERTEAAYRAVTRGDLEAVTADLPGMGAPGAAPAPAQVRRKFTAVMGDCKERISGRVDAELEAVAVMGDVVLDLRGAQVPSGEITLIATAIMGDVKVIVPDGLIIDMTGYCVMGDRKILAREAHPGARVPVLHIRANCVMGDIKIVDDEHHAPIRRAIASWWEQRKTRGG